MQRTTCARGVRFVRFYPSDWRSGCMGLTLEQEGFYIRLCAYIYETGQRLPANDSQAAKFMGLHTNAYRKIRKQLVAIGKVIERDGEWTVERAEKELAAAQGATSISADKRARKRKGSEGSERQAEPDTLIDTPPNTPHVSGGNSGGLFSENANEINGPLLEPIANSHKKERKTPLPPKGGPTPFECLRAFEAYNEVALKLGLAQASKLTPDRKRLIAARLKDYGPDGWAKALANIEHSPHLLGTNDRGWRASLDFLLQSKSFSKVHDGIYLAAADRPPVAQHSHFRSEREARIDRTRQLRAHIATMEI